MLLIDLLIKMF